MASLRAQIVRAGFADAPRALAGLESLRTLVGEQGPLADGGVRLLDVLGEGADPDGALSCLLRLGEAGDRPIRDLIVADGEPLARLVRVLGASRALGDHLARHPDHLLATEPGGLALPSLQRITDLRSAVSGHDGEAAADILKASYRRQLLGIAADDLAAPDPTAVLPEVAVALADLADAGLQAALDIARADVAGAEGVRLAVIALGKTGARELNYISDVDVLYVAEPAPGAGVDEASALALGERLAARLQQICGGTTAEGSLWQVDAGLRPEGRHGPLVRTVASHTAYYRRWAKPWEFQAMLKARFAAGDPDLAGAWRAAVDPLVWTAAEQEGFVDAARAMRRRVVDHIPPREADRELKLGRGGLRDVEFAVQLLQLVHGRTDERLRAPSTLAGLEALTTFGYVGREDGAQLDRAYRFLRVLEHRLQLHRLARTHVLPTDEAAWRRLARATFGPRAGPDQLREAWHVHQVSVTRLHEKLFFRPLLTAVARLSPEEVRLTPQAASARLRALGYVDPEGALRHLGALTSGVSRRAAIQRTLLPVLLGYFADGADPDAGLLGFRRISDALGNTHWYLGMLRDSAGAAERFATVLASGRLVPDLLTAAPEAAVLLGGGDRLRPPSSDGLLTELVAVADRTVDLGEAVRAVRSLHRRELIRTGIADVTEGVTVMGVGQALAASVSVALDVSLRASARDWLASRGHGRVSLGEAMDALPTRLLVVGFGSVAGEESSYGSDFDVVVVHEPRAGADAVMASECARDVLTEARQALRRPSAEPAILVDSALRPEGRAGELVRTMDALASHYERWSQPWEHQALLRARPLIGPLDLAERFVALVDPLRYPPGGLGEAAVSEIRRIKARVEAERLPRGADPRRHVKLGRGGLSDVEWTVQLIQLRHGNELAALRTPSTRQALLAARDAGLLAPDDASRLESAWRFAARLRDAMVLWRGRSVDVLPIDRRDLDGIARLFGFEPGSATALEDEWLRVARHCRGVVERVFFGW